MRVTVFKKMVTMLPTMTLLMMAETMTADSMMEATDQDS